MNWTELDWDALDRLRAGFLSEGAKAEPYWDSESALASYDLTYGERIGWKWDQVLRELEIRHWRPGTSDSAGSIRQAQDFQPAPDKTVGIVLDWGCGSGVAGRRVIAQFGAGNFRELVLWDHSPLAVQFASDLATAKFPGLAVSTATRPFLDSETPIDLLVVSHVLNELTDEALSDLRRVLLRAQAVIWVEAGTSAVSRRLGLLRNELSAQFRVVAPCTHQRNCPMFDPGNERHWCHFFAPPPAGIFADSDWVRFGQRAGIDLRSLPYSFMVLQIADCRLPIANEQPPIANRQFSSRIIGRPEHFKAFARFLNCDERGLKEMEISRRKAPELYKRLERTKEPLVLDSLPDV